MKEFVRDTINSVRRFEQTNSIEQLFKVLEVRDVLSEHDLDCLENIALKLPNSKDLLEKISDYNQSKNIRRENASSAQSHSKEAEDSGITSRPLDSFNKIKKRIFETVIQIIGCFWRKLARNLGICECQIQDIDNENELFHEKATKLMEKYDATDPQRWFFILCDALERIRRKDLVRSIQEIMAMNMCVS